jgi:phosphotransferase system enzyme I (PtsI)
MKPDRPDSAANTPPEKPGASLTGIPASEGIARGPLFILERPEVVLQVEKVEPADVKEELERLEEAVGVLTARLEGILDMQDHQDAKDLAQVQLTMIQDPELRKTIRRHVKQDLLPGDQAVTRAFNQSIRALQARNIPWATERAIDIARLRDQCIGLYRRTEEPVEVPSGSVVFAEEISMGELLQYGRERIAGLLLRHAGLTSHAVLVAQALGIPAVVGFRFAGRPFEAGQAVWVDGSSGEVVLDPDEETDARMRRRKADLARKASSDERSSSDPSVTACGERFSLRANIEVEPELTRMREVHAEGIGLLRTEALLMEPLGRSMADQKAFYGAMLRASHPHPVTIRLFDIGGDKATSGHPAEQNPFLGWRGIRLLLDEPRLLQDQMEAILRVSGGFPGRVRILVPMVSGREELRQVRAMVRETAARLAADGVSVDHALQVGAMVEVPSVALMTEAMAADSDFYSIGTNDLIQYTLAADRGNSHVAHLYDSQHPAVWRLIRLAVQGAMAADRPIAVCGEMASRPVFAAALLGLGIRDLSMPPAAHPGVKRALRGVLMQACRNLADEMCSAADAEQVRQAVGEWTTLHLSGDRDP